MGQANDKKVLKSTPQGKLHYEKDGVEINFSYKTDVKIEMKAIIEILEQAKVDLEKELEMRFPKNA